MGYQVDVLGNARERLTDEENPMLKDEYRDMQQEFTERMPDTVSHELETVGTPHNETPLSMYTRGC